MLHDEMVDYDDEHMLQHIVVNDNIEKQVEVIDVHEVIKFVDLHIKKN